MINKGDDEYMSNPRGSTYPRVTKETNKTQGSTMPKALSLNIEAAIREYRKRPRNNGFMSMAKWLNEGILKDSGETISHTTLHRWWQKHGDDNESNEDMVNIYGEHLSSLKSITKQLDTLEMYLGELNSNVSEVNDIVKVAKETNSLMMTYDKLSARKGSLLGQIGEIQAKVYTYINFNTVLDRVFDMVKAKDVGLHYEILREIEKDPLLTEIIRKIKDENK